MQEILRTHIGLDSDYETFKDEVWVNADTFNGPFYTDVEQLWNAVSAIKEVYDSSWNYESDYAYTIDIHAGNIMFRQDGTLVLNDPLADREIEYEDDLAQWAAEEMGV